jgi:hypothetical protein
VKRYTILGVLPGLALCYWFNFNLTTISVLFLGPAIGHFVASYFSRSEKQGWQLSSYRIPAIQYELHLMKIDAGPRQKLLFFLHGRDMNALNGERFFLKLHDRGPDGRSVHDHLSANLPSSISCLVKRLHGHFKDQL